MSDIVSNNTNPLPKKRGRPRKDPLDQIARQKLIRAGLISLTEHGYSAVSVDEVLTSSGITKGSFYHHFKSKADYGLALIEAYHEYFAAKMMAWFEQSDLAPLDRLRGFVTDAEAGMAKYAFRRGCLVGNLGQEMSVLPADVSERLIAVLEDWQRRTASCLRQAQHQNQISQKHDPDALAAFFWIGWEGAVLRAKLERNPEPLRCFAAGFFTLVSN
ncbi:acrylate utilization transcriptional regulator AcuR [Cohaesibacter celericrescens]|uniref:acrylate utilization transcriptional regulator AcuR n=1 Tax=Cohaesibacter celericrescens TaxID=2067669 RepID=UPI003561C005